MGKRSKGKGKGGKRAAITRRDVDAKRARRDAGGSSSRPPADDEDEGEDKALDEEAEDEGHASGAGEGADETELADEERDAEDAEDAEDARDADTRRAASKADDKDEEAPSELVSEIAEYHSGLPEGASWALPLVKLDHRWTWLETRMLFVCLCTLAGLLCFWFSAKGMSEAVAAPAAAGTVFRALVGAGVLGVIARRATRGRMDEQRRVWITIAAVILGIVTAKLWRGVGIQFFTNLVDWMQKGSVFALFGGFKGVSTRLTMLLALIGGSLAASAGTHIAIDVLVRLISKEVRRPVAVGSALATAAVCLMSSWGFFDHVAITELGAQADDSAGEKIATVAGKLDEQFFVLRKQLKLDIRAIPYVISAKPWNDPNRFKGKDWNQFMDEEGFAERYGERADRIRARESALGESYQPFINVPDDRADGMLRNGLDLIWPLGFLMLALRFVLRALLVLAGHVRADVEGEA